MYVYIYFYSIAKEFLSTNICSTDPIVYACKALLEQESSTQKS